MEEQQKKLQLKRMTRICSKDATQNKNMSQEAVLRNRCYMSGCKNNRICRDKQTTMPMFLFPLDLNLAKFWLGICNHQPYDCPFHGQTVCKDHFQIENLAAGSDTNGIALKPNVIPTAKIPNICYSMILEYLKQRKEGKTLDPKHIGVDFTCSKANCTFARASPSKATTLKCYANPKKASTSKDGSNGGVRITLK